MVWIGKIRAGGQLLGGLVDVRREATVKVLRGSRGDAAGIELGSSSVERSAVNTGTVPVLASYCAASAGVEAGSIVGRSARDGAEPP